MQKDRTLLIIGLIVVMLVALAIWKGHRRRELPPTASWTEKSLRLAEIGKPAGAGLLVWARAR